MMQSVGSQRVRHDLATEQQQQLIYMCWNSPWTGYGVSSQVSLRPHVTHKFILLALRKGLGT